MAMKELTQQVDIYEAGTCGLVGSDMPDNQVNFTPLKTPHPECRDIVPRPLPIIISKDILTDCSCDD